MKRPLQLPLAITLALCGTDALALGLGPVHVKSRLNEPLDAEIPVIQGTAGEAEGLLVNLAAAEDFERIGLNRSRLGVPLDFAVAKGARGEVVIKVTSKEPVREAYLDFLVEANWPKGRLLREYTLLLDPPLTAPARRTAEAPAPASPGTVTLVKRERPPREPAAAAAPRAKPAPAPAPERKVAERKAADGEYGPVEAGETLSAIARATREGEHVNLNQMMLALYKRNPDAFYKDNINALKRGAILRVPSAEEIKAVGSASEAAAQVRAQVEDWRGGRASPTLVADGATPAAPAAAAAAGAASAKPAKPAKAVAEGGERLELVPPKAGRDSLAAATQAGSAAKGGSAELKSELARTKEALTAREQETGELRSRVKELEELKGKNDRLISLKDSEIAELQRKLKELQEKSSSATKPAAAPASASAAAPAAASAGASAPVAATAKPAPSAGEGAKIDKQDIWGDAGRGDAARDAKPAEPAKAPADAPAQGATTLPLAPTPPTTSSTSAPTASSAAPGSPASAPANAPSAPAAAPAAPAATPAAAPAKTAAAAKATPPKTAAKAPATSWYEEGWVKSAALAVGIVLLLAGLFGLRKRKPAEAAAGRGSIADAFGDSPLPGGDGAAAAENEEAKLREQLRHDPSNVGLHLELLSLLYAERNVAGFEEEAAEMRRHVADPHQPEWLEAQSMGQELAPHNPLFADAARFDDSDAMIATAHADTVERPALDRRDDFAREDFARDDFAAAFAEPPRAPAPAPEPAPVFDTSDFTFGTEPAPAKSAQSRDGFDFDDLPPLDFELPTPPPPAAAPAAVERAERFDEPAVPAARGDDVFVDDDAVGTKLDLAKAYMDMGDPEGARSMLEEVLAEGNEAQKSEAHRLMADIR